MSTVTASRPRAASREATLVGEIGAVGVVSGAIGLFYWLLHAAAYNTPGHADPWIYYALFENFGYLYHQFYSTYYTSRLPWIIPGEVAHALLPSVAAFFLLQVTFILSAAAACYLALRRFFGRAVALVGYAALLLNVIFYIAHSDSYPDGAQITYLLLSVSAALLATTSRWPVPLMIASGFFALSAFGTNLFDAFFICGGAIVYLAVVLPRPRFGALLARDVASFAGGALAALVTFGSYAKANGGEFLFFMPSVRVAQTLTTKNWRLKGYAWILREPRLLAALFLVVVGLIVLWRPVRNWRHDPAVRLAAGLVASVGAMTVVLAAWEFVFHGIAVFDIPYYFSVFTAFFGLATAAVAALAVRQALQTAADRRLFVAAAILAAALPVWLVFGLRLTGIVGRSGFYAMTGITVAVAALAIIRQLRPELAASLLATVLGASIFFGVSFSASASFTSSRFSAEDTGPSSYASRIATMHITDQLIAFMRDSGLQTIRPGVYAPNFWYDGSSAQFIGSVQSAYLLGWTAIGFSMPQLGSTPKHLLDVRESPTIVLLCVAQPTCAEGVRSLAAAGYGPRFRATTRLASGSEVLWAKAYTLPRFAALTPAVRFYRRSASPLLRPTGTVLAHWNLAGTRPAGWSADDMRPGGLVITSPRPWNYELVSPTVSLPAGSYAAVLAGRVLRGGVDLGVLDSATNSWIEQGFYWSGQSFRDPLRMQTHFRLARPSKISIVLSNWVLAKQSSRWKLRDVELVRLGGG